MRQPVRPFRFRDRIADPARFDMTAPYPERFKNDGLTTTYGRVGPSSVSPKRVATSAPATASMSMAEAMAMPWTSAAHYRGIANVTPRHNH